MKRKIILAGASGLVGSQVMRLLAGKREELGLHIIGRRQLDNIPDGVIQHVASPKLWPVILESHGFDLAINCLGTTIRQAGSKEAFAAVDHDLVLDFARIVRGDGTSRFISVSSVGAYARSGNHYLSVKGRTEDALKDIGFARLDILRPGLLHGDRQEFRFGESLAQIASPLTNLLLSGSLRRYRSIDSEIVARAIVNLASTDGAGQFIHENDAITALAG